VRSSIVRQVGHETACHAAVTAPNHVGHRVGTPSDHGDAPPCIPRCIGQGSSDTR